MSSNEDASVNCIATMSDGGFLEARYVQRSPDYFIVYLSSHSGCTHTCRFCHLTATNQRMMSPATLEEYSLQAEEIFEIYNERTDRGMSPAQRVHFNFMARGEALSNPHFVGYSQALFDHLRDMAKAHGIERVKFNVSTIMPRDYTGTVLDLASMFADPDSEIYYSLYSLRPGFRKRWLPRALPAHIALNNLACLQERLDRRMTLHWAFIRGQNDSDATVDEIIAAVKRHRLRVKFNLVRYNPYDSRYGTEAAEEDIQRLFIKLSNAFGSTESRIVPRVGYDVKASCGCFIEPSHV